MSEGAAGLVGECEGGVGAAKDAPLIEQGEGASGATTRRDQFEFAPESVAGDGGEPACAILDQCARFRGWAEVALHGEAAGAPEAGGVVLEGSVVEDGEARGCEVGQALVGVEQLAGARAGEGEGNCVDGEVAASEVVLDGRAEGDLGERAGSGVALVAEGCEVEPVAIEGDGGGAKAGLEAEFGVESGSDGGGDCVDVAIDGEVEIGERSCEGGVADRAADGPESGVGVGRGVDGCVEQASGWWGEGGAECGDVRASKRFIGS